MKKRKIFSVLLVLMILFLNVPTDAFSLASEKCESLSDLEKQVNIESDDEIFILEEDTSKRGQFEKHFLCSDGSYIAVTYTESVHYLSNDNYWEDIDLTPEYNTATGKYVKNNGSFGYSFRENASSDDMVEIRTGGHAISWGLEIANNNESKECDIASVTGQAPADNNRILTVSNAKAEIIKENNSSYYTCKKYITDSKSFQLSNSSAKIKYGNYTEDDSISLEYTVYHDKIEEDIIIDKKGSADTFSMNMNIGNLMPEVNPDGSVVLTDESGEVICRIGIPYMMDSAFAVCNDISVKAEENGTNCKITYIPNKEWMNSSERVYPIILDPSVTTSDYVSNIEDTYVEENSSVNHSTEQYLYINRNGNNKRNAIIRINQLPIVDEAMPIISAYLVMTAQSESPDFIDMKAAYLDTGLDIEDYNYGLSQRTYNSFVEYSCFEDGYSNVEFDVSSHIYEMYDDAAWDEENGYDYHGDFVIGLEYSTDTFYVPPFYSSEFTGTASRPKLLIRYGYSLPAGILNNNVYSFMNCGSACYMSVNGTNPANNSNIYQLLGVGNGAQLSQKFKLEYVPSTGGYLLRSMTSSSGTDKVVSINRGTSSIDSNMNIRLSTPNDPIGQEWLVVPIDYYEFKIVPRANMSLAITAYGSSNGSNTGTSYNSAGNIFVKEYDSDNNNQRWYIDDAGGEEIYTGVLRSSVETGTYYVSNSYSGKYLHRNTNNVNCARDKKAVLGENTVQWKIVNLGDGYCTIQRSDLPEFYIAQDGDGVKVVFRSSESIDEKCKWNIRFLSGAYLIMNKNGKYLTYNSSNSTVSLSNLSSAGTNSYKMQQWRIVEEEDYVELGYSFSISDITLTIGESKTAVVNKSPSNSSWSNYNDFEYSIVSGNQYVSFNNSTGQYTGVNCGTVLVIATHKTTGISATLSIIVSPLRVFETKRRPGLEEDGTIARDMKVSDLSQSQLTAINYNLTELARMYDLGPASSTVLPPQGPDALICYMEQLPSMFAVGNASMRNVVYNMVDRFLSGTGNDFSDPALTSAVQNHSSTISFVSNSLQVLTSAINDFEGEIVLLATDAAFYNNMTNVPEPVYNTIADYTNGLKIALNGIWGYNIDIVKYEFDGANYSGIIQFTLFDHFGLDVGDITDSSGTSELLGYTNQFGSWFVLQRYINCNSQYKPFVTYIVFEQEFSGSIS